MRAVIAPSSPPLSEQEQRNRDSSGCLSAEGLRAGQRQFTPGTRTCRLSRATVANHNPPCEPPQ